MTGLFTGPAESNSITLATADNDVPQTLIEIPDDALYQLERLRVEYAEGATVDVDIAVFDDADGTASGGVSDQRDMIRDVAPDSHEDREFGPTRYFEEDVLVQEPAGAQDGDVTITAQGRLLTTLTDVMQ